MNNLYDEKPKNEFEKPEKLYAPQERGGCLSVFLAGIIAVNVLFILHLCYTSNFLPLLVVTMVVQGGVIACAVAIWNWKKWGIYGLALTYVIQAGVMLSAGDASAAVISIGALFVLFLLVNYQMDKFD
jgi:hypothetical protein